MYLMRHLIMCFTFAEGIFVVLSNYNAAFEIKQGSIMNSVHDCYDQNYSTSVQYQQECSYREDITTCEANTSL